MLAQFLDFQAAKGKLVAVVLQQQMPGRGFAEMRPDVVFAPGHQRFKGQRAAVVFECFHPIKVMFDMIRGIDDHPPDISRPDGSLTGHRLDGRNQVVERGQGAVAVGAELGVGMPSVVEQLVL